MSKVTYKSKIKDENLRDVFSFLKLLSESGISLKDSLNLMGSSLSKGSSFNFKELINHMNDGKTMNKSLELIGIEDRFVLSIIEIAEMAGKLPQAFGELEAYYSGKLETRSELFKAFAYPCTVLISITFLIFGILTYIVPKIVGDFFVEGDILPVDLKLIMDINDIIRNNVFSIFAVTSIVIVLIMILASNANSKMIIEGYISDKSPFASIMKKIYIKNFAWKIYILLKSGMDIYSAIDVVKVMEKNLYYKRELEKMEEILLMGESITKAARATKICDEVVIAYIDKGNETDKMADAFENIWRVYERYLKEYIKKLKATLQPATVMILGIIVALLAMLVMSITDVSNFITEVS